MALSAAAPSLNRFPGLSLRAWALVMGATIIQGSKVSSVTNSAGSVTLNFSESIAGGQYVVDVSAAAPSYYVDSVAALSVRIAFRDDTGASVSSGMPIFFAIYG